MLLDTPMQTRISDQPAYILHRRDWQNTSLLLDVITRDYGRLSLLAKGGKTSKARAYYQPFCRLSISWIGRQELKTLIGIDGLMIPVATQNYLSLLYINELVTAFLPQHESNIEVFNLYERLVNNIHFDESDLREFEKAIMELLGYFPDTSIDAGNGEKIDPEKTYQFIASSGFILCHEDDNNSISGMRIIDWQNKNYSDDYAMQLAKTVMRSIIDYNLNGKKLKSRDIYLQMKSYL